MTTPYLSHDIDKFNGQWVILRMEQAYKTEWYGFLYRRNFIWKLARSSSSRDKRVAIRIRYTKIMEIRGATPKLSDDALAEMGVERVKVSRWHTQRSTASKYQACTAHKLRQPPPTSPRRASIPEFMLTGTPAEEEYGWVRTTDGRLVSDTTIFNPFYDADADADGSWDAHNCYVENDDDY